MDRKDLKCDLCNDPLGVVTHSHPAMTHTPGPWEVGPLTKKGPLSDMGAIDPPAILDSGGEYVACLGGGSIHFANANANARLIAAAPELLAALKIAIDKIEAWRDGALVTRNWAVGTSIPDMEKLIASYNAIIDPARAAIAKVNDADRLAICQRHSVRR